MFVKYLKNTLVFIVKLITNPFSTIVMTKGTAKSSKFFRRHVYVVFIIALIVTALILYFGYYDEKFKELF